MFDWYIEISIKVRIVIKQVNKIVNINFKRWLVDKKLIIYINFILLKFLFIVLMYIFFLFQLLIIDLDKEPIDTEYNWCAIGVSIVLYHL